MFSPEAQMLYKYNSQKRNTLNLNTPKKHREEVFVLVHLYHTWLQRFNEECVIGRDIEKLFI